MSRPATLGELKATGYRTRSVKDELRANLIARLRSGESHDAQSCAPGRSRNRDDGIGKLQVAKDTWSPMNADERR